MRLALYLNKSVHDNAAVYYELAKEARKKRDGLIAAIEETTDFFRFFQEPASQLHQMEER